MCHILHNHIYLLDFLSLASSVYLCSIYLQSFLLTFLALWMMIELVYCVTFFTCALFFNRHKPQALPFDSACFCVGHRSINPRKGLSDVLNSNDRNGAAASVYMLEAGSCRVLQSEVIDGPALLLLKI